MTVGNDYTLDQNSLTFMSGANISQQMCVMVNIIDDDFVESNKTFMVVFSLATPDMFLGGSNVSITIIDRDGECILGHSFKFKILHFIKLLFVLVVILYNAVFWSIL